MAWPSGDWGSLPLEGGVEAAFKGRLARADDPEKLKAEVRPCGHPTPASAEPRVC